jgi:hypothetical protein
MPGASQRSAGSSTSGFQAARAARANSVSGKSVWKFTVGKIQTRNIPSAARSLAAIAVFEKGAGGVPRPICCAR